MRSARLWVGFKSVAARSIKVDEFATVFQMGAWVRGQCFIRCAGFYQEPAAPVVLQSGIKDNRHAGVILTGDLREEIPTELRDSYSYSRCHDDSVSL